MSYIPTPIPTGDIQGLGSAAALNVGTTTGTVAAGDAVAGAAQKTANLSDLANAGTARTNLGLGTAAQSAVGAFDAAGSAAAAQAASLPLSGTAADSLKVGGTTPSAFGRSLIDDVDAATARTTLGAGTVLSVAQTVPAEFSVAGSPITLSGTLAITKAAQVANRVWAGPTTGADAEPTFRALGSDDIPTLAQSKITNLAADLAAKALAARLISTTAPVTGGGDLSADRTIAVSDFVASGASHARGTVPTPGASAGTTKYLREDATWVVPPTGAAGNLASTLRVQAQDESIAVNCSVAAAADYEIGDGVVLDVLSNGIMEVL